MRSQLFRTNPTLVADVDQVVALKDVDGDGPLNVYVENVDQHAVARTRFGSKNANLRFVAVEAGEAGNDLSVLVESVVEHPADQAFAVVAYAGVVTVTLRTDSGGAPNLTADQVAALLNADSGTAALMRVSRALGSDGSGVFGLEGEIDDPEPAAFSSPLVGGASASDLTGVKVSTSPTGWPNFPGPWIEVEAPDVPAGAVVAVAVVDKPTRGLRVRCSPGPYPTTVVVSAVRQRGA